MTILVLKIEKILLSFALCLKNILRADFRQKLQSNESKNNFRKDYNHTFRE